VRFSEVKHRSPDAGRKFRRQFPRQTKSGASSATAESTIFDEPGMRDPVKAKNTQTVLPSFPEREYVDMGRACRILGLSWTTVSRLAASGMVDMVDYRSHSVKRIRYASIVDLCNRLRREFAIPDRRKPQSSPSLRYRDEDLLPFPLSDTITADDALGAMGSVSRKGFLKLVEEGRFWAYRFAQAAPWWISRSSLAAYLDRVHPGARRSDTALQPNGTDEGRD